MATALQIATRIHSISGIILNEYSEQDFQLDDFSSATPKLRELFPEVSQEALSDALRESRQEWMGMAPALSGYLPRSEYMAARLIDRFPG